MGKDIEECPDREVHLQALENILEGYITRYEKLMGEYLEGFVNFDVAAPEYDMLRKEVVENLGEDVWDYIDIRRNQ